MALYRVTVKRTVIVRGIRLEKGMSVEVPCVGNPLAVRAGQDVSDAFQRIYGIDLKKIGAANLGYLNVEKIN